MVISGGIVLIVRRRPEGVSCFSAGRYEDDGHNGLRIYNIDDELVEELQSGSISGWQTVTRDNQIIDFNIQA
jgi:hypothetical protein